MLVFIEMKNNISELKWTLVLCFQICNGVVKQICFPDKDCIKAFMNNHNTSKLTALIEAVVFSIFVFITILSTPLIS